MWSIGVDYHLSVQQIAFINTDTGECGQRRLSHREGEAEKFYRELKAAGCRVRVGIVDQRTLAKMDEILQQHAYRNHEFGDSVFVEKSRDRAADMEPVVFVTRYRHADLLTKAISV